MDFLPEPVEKRLVITFRRPCGVLLKHPRGKTRRLRVLRNVPHPLQVPGLKLLRPRHGRVRKPLLELGKAHPELYQRVRDTADLTRRQAVQVAEETNRRDNCY